MIVRELSNKSSRRGYYEEHPLNNEIFVMSSYVTGLVIQFSESDFSTCIVL